MPYEVEIRDCALDDLKAIPQNIQSRIIIAIEKRLVVSPTQYGLRLRQSLGGLWKIRVGDYRVVYEIENVKVVVWAICHRKEVYVQVNKRWLK